MCLWDNWIFRMQQYNIHRSSLQHKFSLNVMTAVITQIISATKNLCVL